MAAIEPARELFRAMLIIHDSELFAYWQPFMEDINQQFTARVSPPLRTRGVPTRAQIRQKMPNGGDYALIQLLLDPRWGDWIQGALFDEYEWESQLLEYALTIPFGLHYWLKAVSEMHVFEMIRRCRVLINAPLVRVIPRIECEFRLGKARIPLSFFTPPKEQLGDLATRRFFIEYTSYVPRDAQGVFYWVGPSPREELWGLLPDFPFPLPVTRPVVRIPHFLYFARFKRRMCRNLHALINAFGFVPHPQVLQQLYLSVYRRDPKASPPVPTRVLIELMRD